MDNYLTELLQKLSDKSLRNEEECVRALAEDLEAFRGSHEAIAARAAAYIANIRKLPRKEGVENFFRQYGLDSKEGIAILSLAESLLRIPDSKTQNELIHDKMEGLENDSVSSIGIKIAGSLFNMGKAVTNVADPIIRESIKQTVRHMGKQFVIGEDMKEALDIAKKYGKKGYLFSYDMLGEGARTSEQAEHYTGSYMAAIDDIAAKTDISKDLYKRPSISVKLSALHPRYELANKENVLAKLMPRLKHIIEKAMMAGIYVTIDAEETRRLDLSLEIFTLLLQDEKFKQFDGIGLAVQAYHTHAVHVIGYLVELASYCNKRLPVRLVKGAYWDSEIKNAQMLGLSTYPVFTRKEHTDISYLACAYKLLNNSDCLYPQFATHNAMTIAAIEEAAGDRDFEFQLLYGMGQSLYNQIVAGRTCRIYAPVGQYKELLPYLIRRMLENGANSSFVKQITDEKISMEALTGENIGIAESNGYKPSDKIPQPCDIFQEVRRNSQGFDLGNKKHLAKIESELAVYENRQWSCKPIINGRETGDAGDSINSPYDIRKKIGTVTHASHSNIKDALDIVSAAHGKWVMTNVEERALIFERMADLLEENKLEAMAICIHEAGKNIADAIAEVREAVDFCRYYAQEARRLFSKSVKLSGYTGEESSVSLHGRGMFICISPWNFPLAIFLGQISAALVSGNTVIAKPAEQTPLIASFAVKLLLKAGLPGDVIALLPGGGDAIGKYLINDMRTAGVVFTGSTATAKIINRALARRGSVIVPFIAETGGQNAMIADSSALIEQLVDDIIISAFGSAGQRCSALRVLYVQDDIADQLIETLKGAMAEIKSGCPARIATYTGPIIDHKARDILWQHTKQMAVSHKLIAAAPISKHDTEHGYFLPAHAFEISSMSDLPGEMFGPIVHIIRYKAGGLDKVIEEINNSGFGLTLGIESRIEKNIEYIRKRVRVGNIYVNRSMTGAVVGFHPFGGEGLSGTGPKAGGPNYLMRFVTERTYTVNTTAIGGNRELLV